MIEEKKTEEKEVEKEMGRPSKIKKFLEAFGKVINEGSNSIILTDEELFLLSNEELAEEDRICYTTFKNYKASVNKEENGFYQNFLSLYKKAITIQKKSLFESLRNDPQSWQRYAWIIERKFSEWNLKIISEVDQKNSGEIIFKIKE